MKARLSSLAPPTSWRPFLVAALLCLPAAWPYLGGDLPRTNDSLFHLFRAVELSSLVRAGDFFPRWGPHFAHGYGYPTFNYFAHFTHYVVTALHLAGLSLVNAVRVAYGLGLLGAGLGAFVLGRDLAAPQGGGYTGNLAGWAATAAYAYSPYLLYTAHVRGGLPETVALAFVPLAFWGIRRALVAAPAENGGGPFGLRRSTGYAALAAVAIAGIIASHLGMALQYLPLLGLWGLFCSAYSWRREPPFSLSFNQPFGRSLLVVGALFALALGLTASIWLPSALELGYVQFEAAFARAGLVYTGNFLQALDLITYPSLPIYTDVVNPPIVRPLPLAALAVACLGLLRWRSLPRRAFVFMGALLALCCFLTLDLSRPLWDAIGLLQRSAFPWRFLGPASLCAALLAAMAVGALSPAQPARTVSRMNGWLARWAAPHAPGLLDVRHLPIIVLVATAAPFLFPPREPAPQAASLADLARFEIPPLLVGTTTTGEYTPAWVAEFPPTAASQAALLEGREPVRLEAPGATVEHLSARPSQDVYSIGAERELTAIYHTFYFPGWEATLDGRPLPIRITQPHGLMAFDIPAGEHTLEIRFGATPVRAVADAVTVAAWLLLAGIGAGWILRRRRPDISPPTAGGAVSTVGRASGLVTLGFSYAALLFAAVVILRPGPPPVVQGLDLDFGGELMLLGYDQASLDGRASEIQLMWLAQRPLGVAYGFNLRLTDDAGLIWSDTNIQRPPSWRFFPGTHTWAPGQVVLDTYIVNPLPGAPPGRYHLEAIVYRADTLQALAVQQLGDYLVEVPTNLPQAAALLALDGLALIDIQADRPEAAPGEAYRLTLLWQAGAHAPPEQEIDLQLVDAAGNIAYARAEHVVPQYSSHHWRMGDVYRQEVFFRLPAALPGGSYRWQVAEEGLPAAAAPALVIHAPARSFEKPALTHPRQVDFGSSVRLLGYNARIDGSDITIELAWQALGEVGESYRVFLHLLDSGGGLVSQSDGEPANWTRPTTGWLPGEVVFDARRLSAPGPGEYHLRVGLVNEAGERLFEAAELGVISLEP